MVSSKSMRSVANFTTASRLHSVASRLSLPLGPSVRTGYLTSIGTSTANGDEEGSRTEVSNSKQRRRVRPTQASTGEHRRAQTSANEHAVARRESSKRLLWLYSTSLFLFLPSSRPPFFLFSSQFVSARRVSQPFPTLLFSFSLYALSVSARCSSPFCGVPFCGSRTGFFVRTRCTATSPTAQRERTTRSREAKRSRCCGQHLAISDNQLSPLSKNT